MLYFIHERRPIPFADPTLRGFSDVIVVTSTGGYVPKGEIVARVAGRLLDLPDIVPFPTAGHPHVLQDSAELRAHLSTICVGSRGAKRQIHEPSRLVALNLPERYISALDAEGPNRTATIRALIEVAFGLEPAKAP